MGGARGGVSECLNDGIDILLQALHARCVSLLVAKILLLSDALGNQTLGESAAFINNHFQIRTPLLQVSHLRREGGREGGGREGGKRER